MSFQVTYLKIQYDRHNLCVNVSGDDLNYHDGQPFSTYDSDNDAWPGNCAESRQGAFWYGGCGRININGPYLVPGTVSWKSMWWLGVTGDHESLKATTLMVRAAL